MKIRHRRERQNIEKRNDGDVMVAWRSSIRHMKLVAARWRSINISYGVALAAWQQSAAMA